MKKHKLEPESIGEDTYIVISKGHHDFKEFMKETLALYNWPLGTPEHIWMRCIPANGDYAEQLGWRYLYVPAEKGSRGAFPVTYVREAYGAEEWNAGT